ncbi:MAG: sodium:calcium antiporter [Thermodesulfobacteriota bacterium]
MIPASAHIWLEFLACLTVIGFAGVKLAFYGDVIADKTGMGGTWVGVIMLATVTSLPELVTGVVSVSAADFPDIAVGDLLGACVFNLVILVLLDFLHRGKTLYQESGEGHVLSAAFGILLSGFVGFNIFVSHNGTQPPALLHIGLYTPIIMIIYAAGVRTVFRYEKTHVAAFTDQAPDQCPHLSLAQSVLRYCLAALLVVGAGIWLPFIGNRIALAMQWQHSFVGTVFIAIATTVPELAVSVAAVRIGALDMAIANLLGSNMFNMFILALDDLCYTSGPLLTRVSRAHVVSSFSVMIMTGLAIIGLFYKPRGRVLRTVGWTSIFLFSFYLLNSYMLYLFSR